MRSVCQIFLFALLHRANEWVASPFELAYFDVWRPCSVIPKSGFRYFATFIDHYSHVTWLHLTRFIPDFCSYCAKIKTLSNLYVHILQCENVKEYNF